MSNSLGGNGATTAPDAAQFEPSKGGGDGVVAPEDSFSGSSRGGGKGVINNNNHSGQRGNVFSRDEGGSGGQDKRQSPVKLFGANATPAVPCNDDQAPTLSNLGVKTYRVGSQCLIRRESRNVERREDRILLATRD